MITVTAHPEGPYPGSIPWPIRKYDRYGTVNPPPLTKDRFHAGNDRDLKFEIAGVTGDGEATLMLHRDDDSGSGLKITVNFVHRTSTDSPLEITLLHEEESGGGSVQGSGHGVESGMGEYHLGTGPDGKNGSFTATVSVTGTATTATQTYQYTTKKD